MLEKWRTISVCVQEEHDWASNLGNGRRSCHPSSAKVFKGIQARGMAEIVVKSVIHRDGQVVREIQQHSVVVLWEGWHQLGFSDMSMLCSFCPFRRNQLKLWSICTKMIWMRRLENKCPGHTCLPFPNGRSSKRQPVTSMLFLFYMNLCGLNSNGFSQALGSRPIAQTFTNRPVTGGKL